MVSTSTEKSLNPAEQIRKAIDLFDSVTSLLCKESHTRDNHLAKTVEQINLVKSRLSSISDIDSHGLSSIIDSCNEILDDAIRQVKEAPVVSLNQAKFVKSLYQIQSFLYRLSQNRCSNSEVPPPLPSSTKNDPSKLFATQTDGKERRQHRRVPLETDVDFIGDTNFYTGFVEDISSGGLYVSTFNLQPIGTHIELSFTLPNGHQITVPGQVRWVLDPIDPDDASYPGMGIMFEELNIEDKKQIEAFINERSPLFYDEDL